MKKARVLGRIRANLVGSVYRNGHPEAAWGAAPYIRIMNDKSELYTKSLSICREPIHTCPTRICLQVHGASARAHAHTRDTHTMYEFACSACICVICVRVPILMCVWVFDRLGMHARRCLGSCSDVQHPGADISGYLRSHFVSLLELCLNDLPDEVSTRVPADCRPGSDLSRERGDRARSVTPPDSGGAAERRGPRAAERGEHRAGPAVRDRRAPPHPRASLKGLAGDLQWAPGCTSW